MKTLYERLTEAGIKIDNHYSDLYFLWTEESSAILAEFFPNRSRSFFISTIDGKTWCDVPFSFDPYWKAKAEAPV